MRAVQNTDDGICVVDVAEPDGPGIVVEPRTVGICGSDLHVLGLGGKGLTFGHEIGALLDGRAVAIQPFPFCGSCEQCARSIPHLCVSTRSSLLGMQCDGGMAERLLVDPSCLVELPSGMDTATAALVEPIAVAVHALGLAALSPGMRVAVIGGGTVGQVTGAAALLTGVTVDIATRHAAQHACAEKLGLGRAPTKGYDVVFDAAGTESSLAAAVRAVRPGGTIVAPGIYWSDVTLPGFAVCLKEIRILPSIYYGMQDGRREIDIAAELLPRIPGLADAIVSHRFPLERAAEAFATAASREAGAIKVVVDIEA